MKEKSLFIRLDKIGDLVATLPVDQAEFLQDQEITWIVESNVSFIPEMAEPRRSFMTLSLKKPWASFRDLLSYFKSTQAQRVVIFYAPWWVSLAAWVARVPLRGGRRSQWHSYLFFNKSLRQSRSQSEKHEADYNWELLHFAFDQQVKSAAPLLKIKSGLLRQLFEKFDLRSKSYVVVHPGMAGSALNWPTENYVSLVEKLTEFSVVAITGTKADEKWILPLEKKFLHHPKVRFLNAELSVQELIFILQNAKATVAPSTGVLHLSAATGTPSIGIYSPIKAHHPKRWGPRGLGTKVLLPQVDCPAKIDCLGPKCPHFNCMSQITPESVLREILGKINP